MLVYNMKTDNPIICMLSKLHKLYAYFVGLIGYGLNLGYKLYS